MVFRRLLTSRWSADVEFAASVLRRFLRICTIDRFLLYTDWQKFVCWSKLAVEFLTAQDFDPARMEVSSGFRPVGVVALIKQADIHQIAKNSKN